MFELMLNTPGFQGQISVLLFKSVWSQFGQKSTGKKYLPWGLPGFLASAASCEFGITVQKKIEEIRRSKKCKPLYPVIACVDESLRFSSLS